MVRCITRVVLVVVLAAPFAPAEAQTSRVASAGGEVESRVMRRVPGLSADQRARARVGADSAQRVALHDFGWRGRVVSLEIDEEDARLFWDVKIVPDARPTTIVRYRIDATSGGILGIKEFTGIRISKPR